MRSIKVWRVMLGVMIVGILILSTGGYTQGKVLAQEILKDDPPGYEIISTEVINPYYSVEHIITRDGTHLERQIINGPPTPPAEFEAERIASIKPLNTRGTYILANFPSYAWVLGCSAVSGAMIAAYYDNNGHTNMYTGPTNNGQMPLTDTSWPTWSDGFVTYPNNPLVASHIGVDGRSTRGSIDDYWVQYDSTAQDPYITGGWTQHTWSDAIGDYMKTSQFAYLNNDGATSFWNYTSIPDKYTCSYMASQGVQERDGTWGKAVFYATKGYTVTDCYNQKTDNNSGGFTLADFQAEINSGNPVQLNLAGHSVVGYGYNGSTIYIRDTWDSNPANTYTMIWGTSYSGMALESVSVVKPVYLAPNAPGFVSASDGTYTDKVQVSWNYVNDATYYQVYRNTSNSITGATQLTASNLIALYNDTSAFVGTIYYYWVKACNDVACSAYSPSDSGWRDYDPPPAPTGVAASDGTFTDKVRVSWNGVGSYYQVFRNTSNSSSGATQLTELPLSNSPFDDTSAVVGTTYYYWVKACYPGDCSNFSASDSGWRAYTIPAVPTGVTATDGTLTDKVQVLWNSVNGATFYHVYRNTINSTVGAVILTSGDTNYWYDDTSAVAGTVYFYWVKACNLGGCSGYSASDSGYFGIPIPAAPTGVTASRGTYRDKVRVSWNPVSGATYYKVYRDTSIPTTRPMLLTPDHAASPYDDTSALVGTIYYYWVKACNPGGCSGYSALDLGWRGYAALPAPTGVAASDGTSTDKVRVFWNGVGGATYYQVYRNTSDSTDRVQQLTANHAASPYDDPSAVIGTTYYYWLKACNSGGCSGYSLSDSGWRAAYIAFLPLIIR